jgi:UDP-N-acetylmuramoyl-L-alanyl-D-glutamate--2,6-diaminopimelate ligase
VDFQLALAGSFNVQNALAAISAVRALGVPVSAMRAGLAEAHVPGRMELFNAFDGKLVIVDYAHNQMSFDALFAAVHESYPAAAVSIVFGCPGGHAYDRRRDLGLIAGREADDVVLTEEDAGEEAIDKISAEVADYVRQAGGRARIINDRALAIQSALDEAPFGSVILITGKGRETRQKRGLEYIDVVSDVEIVENYIKERS